MLQREDTSFSVGAVGLWFGLSGLQWLCLPFIENREGGAHERVKLAPGGILLNE